MLKVYAVCAAGIGTSLFAKKIIGEAVEALGYDRSQFDIGCTSVREAKTHTDVDVFISVMSLESIIDSNSTTTLRVSNIINDLEGVKNAVEPVLEKAVEEGKITK